MHRFRYIDRIETRRRGPYEYVLLAVLTLAVVAAALALTRRDDYGFFDPLIDIRAIVTDRYVVEPDEAAMQLGAINGMLAALQDPHTFYIPPDRRREFDKELTGDFVGIGVLVSLVDGWLTVVTPMEDTPAFRAGIMADDRIVEVEGTPTVGKTIDECIDLLAGEPGTDVHLVVDRGGRRIPMVIRRERLAATTVKGIHRRFDDPTRWEHLLDPARRIAYVRLTQFTEHTVREVEQTLRSLDNGLAGLDSAQAGPDATGAGLGGLILDVRWNPGGLLSAAADLADLFLTEGVIVSTAGRVGEPEVYRARAEGTFPPVPIVVLINGQSASASEVLAGALVENGRAIAIGTRTFGKGSVQVVRPLPSGDGGALKITEQRYLLPSGRSLHRMPGAEQWGVDPSPGYYVPLSDAQERAVLDMRRQQEIIRRDLGRAAPAASQSRWDDPDWIEQTAGDAQLAAAVRALQRQIESGTWEPTGRPAPSDADMLADELASAQRLRARILADLARVEMRIGELRAGGVGAPKQDLWPDEINLNGGTLRVFDAAGGLVAELRIGEVDPEPWLIEAGLVPMQSGGASAR